jgi:competence ComEA-like helix-hairpin-helix protein
MTNDASPSTDRVDLNQADVEALTLLPGIGLGLASRIVRYREEVGPFQEPMEIAAVPGISETMYRRLADRISVSSPPEEEFVSEVEEVSALPETEEMIESEAEIGEEEPEEPAEAKAEEPPDEWVTEPVEPIAPAPPGAPSAVVRGEGWRERPRPRPQPARIGCLRQVLLVLVSALGGALLALLVMQSINRTLDIAAHPSLLRLGDDVSGLERQDEVLSGEIGELRDRLNQVEALSGRLQQAEADLQTVNQALATLEAQVTGLEEDVSDTKEAVEQVQAAADRFDQFLDGLRDLLLVTQGTPVPAPTVTPSATFSPTPSETPERTGTIQATSTATRTPRPTRTPTPGS